MGTDTIFGRPVFLTRTSPSACQPVETDWGSPPPPKKGTDTESHHVRETGLLTAGPAQAPVGRSKPAVAPGYWGQTRCPIYRSRTFNVQLLTLNVQCGD